MKTEVDMAMKGMAKNGESAWGDMLHGIKGQFGRGSTFKETFEMLAGGGIIMGASIAGEQIKKLSEGLLELKKEARDTGGDWETMGEKIGASLPVVGSFFTAGLNIRELITGEKADLEESTNYLKAAADSLAFHKSQMQQVKNIAGEYRDTMREIAQEFSLIGKSGDALKLQVISNETENKIVAAVKGSGVHAGLTDKKADQYDADRKLVASYGLNEPYIPSEAEFAARRQQEFNRENHSLIG
ncbi:MAG: hypothetical protein WCI73_02380, partial [Phycisphaerae bacterium]